jgi:hypothetical protein
VNLQEQAISIAALIAAVTAIAIFTYRVYKIARRIDDTLGVDKEGRTISDRLQRVEHQLFPNGGTSLSDKITRVESEQRVMQGKLDTVETIVNSLLRESK